MKKIKEFMKSYTLGFVISILLCGTVGVYAATYIESNLITYDNTESGMNSDNVQTAIDELYNTCFPKAGDQILEDNELEKDPYECRYFFTGANPNNYITFNNETAGWRIISVECDGRIKIMRIDSIGNIAWDTNRTQEWSNSSLNIYLNNNYYNSLDLSAKNQIVTSDFNAGAVSNLTDLQSQINEENSTIWNGEIALPTLSEYFRINSNKKCQTFQSLESNYSTCKSTSWMYSCNSWQWWTLTSSAYFEDSAYYIVISEGQVDDYYKDATSNGVRPTLYLSSEVQITGGNGTQSNPYTIK